MYFSRCELGVNAFLLTRTQQLPRDCWGLQPLVFQYLFLISKLESISDKDMKRQSESLELLEKGDDCIADRGFKIKDLLDPIEATLNILPFVSEKGQFCEEEVETTPSVYS